jgi:glucose/arabinose dehydrogenase
MMGDNPELINPTVRSLRFLQLLRRACIALGLLIAAALAVTILLNVRGWRALVLARLLRTDNYPLVVTPPANFQPLVPPGFKVSVFARGFTEPRWLAVAPNGNVFVADSAVGEVVVLHDPQRQGSAQSREIFANHLNMPFGIAFRDD